jgi:hypothetical protein
MGTLPVEHSLEFQKSDLLLPQISFWRARRLLFESLMHALVAAVLLRLARLDSLMSDAQS